MDDDARIAAAELARRFETQRGPLRALAFRMLGSVNEADDAVQETWLKLHRVDADEIRNLDAWLRTAASRVCLDMLRARASHPEEPGAHRLPGEDPQAVGDGADPEQEAVLVDGVGRAMLVVLDTLTPAERVAFVLHDLFAVPFDEIAPVVDRTPATAKKLASRARLRVHAAPEPPAATQLARQRRVVEAFLSASRTGDLAALLQLLTADVVRRTDASALPPGAATEARGVRDVADGILAFGRRARHAAPALVDGAVGAIVAPRGRLAMVITFTIVGDRIAAYDVVADPARLRRLTLAVLDEVDEFDEFDEQTDSLPS
ncbi:sigma factor [Streptacidiphilus fuscans]|uniref:RNA polymerase subunit sigma-70 n=1 Tax=Streptacidiphilus fuscans TaxID=2789292 RepID=A0A931AYD2_9ACTN|nr:sigma factor [Streptacidiphilus fuscans]MBF9067001.1 RNA polymerase subunit sigma-70 [Streptacidiphilus fuscans]